MQIGTLQERVSKFKLYYKSTKTQKKHNGKQVIEGQEGEQTRNQESVKTKLKYIQVKTWLQMGKLSG